MKKEVVKENSTYITINIIFAILFIAGEILSYTIFGNEGDSKLIFRVLARGIMGLLLIYNSLYLLFTSKWSFLSLNASPKRRLINGIMLGVVGLIGLVTALLGYGTNGDPRLIWWK